MNDSGIQVFAFGDPEPVTSLPEIFGTWAWLSGEGWYEPPVPWKILAQSYRASSYHGSAIQLKRDMLAEAYIPHPLLSRSEFKGLVLDYLILGNAFLQRMRGRTGKTIGLTRRMAKYVRRGLDLNSFYWLPDYMRREELPSGQIFHLMESDIDQEIYGLPDYLGALQATWLNESATLFRRKYYTNGSHAGFILYISDATQNQEDIDAIREALRSAKGPGNFRNLFVYSPNGKKDGIQLIPVSEVAAKDDFLHITTVSRDAQLAAHRVPPQLLGIVPTNSAGFGSIGEARDIFRELEVLPIQATLLQVNDWLGEPVIAFRPPTTAA